MPKYEQVKLTLTHKKILDALKGQIHTWDELRVKTKINDEQLGLRLGELLDFRRIWTAHRHNERVYGIERRTGIVPRLTYEQRRESDFLT